MRPSLTLTRFPHFQPSVVFVPFPPNTGDKWMRPSLTLTRFPHFPPSVVFVPFPSDTGGNG